MRRREKQREFEFVVVERFKSGPSAEAETGWICEEFVDDDTKRLREDVQRSTGVPWDVQTVILDENWDGPVWVGAHVVVSRAPSGKGERTLFRCVSKEAA